MNFRLIESIEDNNLINQISKYYEVTNIMDKDAFQRSFILPNGDFLVCSKSNGGASENYHSVIKNIDNKISSGEIQFNGSFNDYSFDNLIRCNGEFENYIVIPTKCPTNSQFYSLEDWLTHFAEVKPSYYSVKVVADRGYKQISYRVSDYNPMDIINKIRRFYQTGILTENKKKKC